MLNDPSVDLRKLIGISIHGDGAEFYRAEEFFVYSWSSIFGIGGLVNDVLMYKFPIAVLAERQMLEAGAT